MQRLVLGTALSLVLAGATSAADLIPYKAPPIYDWTGLYIGGHVGWETGNVGGIDCDPFQCNALNFGSYRQSIGGVLGGGQIGVNHQFHRTVLGLELSGSWDGASGSTTGTIPAGTIFNTAVSCLTAVNPSGVNVTVSCNAKQLWTAQLLGKFGYAVGDGRLLPYVTGGIALTELDAGVTGTAPPVSETSAARKTIAGSALGAGVQYAFGYGWSAGAEYLYTRYNTQDFSNTILCSPTPCGFTHPFLASNHDLATQTIRAVLNFKFD